MTAISAELLAAYRETEYRVLAPAPFTLRVDVASPALRDWHARAGVSGSAWLTACNPYSQRLDDVTNAARQRELAQAITQLGLTAMTGTSSHPGNDWPAEASLLVLGLDESAARRLGRQWEQNAILCCGADARPRLVLLR